MKSLSQVFWLFMLANSCHAWELGLAQGLVFRGHEELTRRAYDSAPGFFTNEGIDTFARESKHPLIIGNFSADFPEEGFAHWTAAFRSVLMEGYGVTEQEIMASPLTANLIKGQLSIANLRRYGQLISGAEGGNWHESGTLQVVHFMRGFSTADVAGLQSAHDACENSKSVIVALTKNAFDAYPSYIGEKLEAYYKAELQFKAGVAIHIIQDSFSPAHTRRTGPDFRKLEDLCIYGLNEALAGQATVCVHKHPSDGRDVIWKKTVPFTEELKDEAAAAVLASKAYLHVLDNLMKTMTALRADPPPPVQPATPDLPTLQAWALAKSAWLTSVYVRFLLEADKQMSAFFHQNTGPGTGMFVCPP